MALPEESNEVADSRTANSHVRAETKEERDARKAKERASRRAGISFAEVEDKYFVETRIGAGTYGAVYKAVNRETNEVVAIKKCSDVFTSSENGKRVLREIKLLSFFRNENVLSLKDVPVPKTAGFTDVFIITEVMDFDLGQVIYSPQQLAEEHYSYFLFQILKGLRYIHSAGIIHRDLKPQNILVMENCDCKICDFGLSRCADDDSMKTTYVVTRWYRAPELLLQKEGHGDYTYAIDIWSVGCILAEVIRRKPLFRADDEMGMVNLIIDTIPLPEAADDFWMLPWVKKRPYLAGKVGKIPQATLEDLLSPHFKDKTNYSKTLDFIKQCLQWDPRKRAACIDLLKHPFLAHLSAKECGVDAEKKFEWEYDGVRVDREKLRELFLQEIETLNPTKTGSLSKFGQFGRVSTASFDDEDF